MWQLCPKTMAKHWKQKGKSVNKYAVVFYKGRVRFKKHTQHSKCFPFCVFRDWL